MDETHNAEGLHAVPQEIYREFAVALNDAGVPADVIARLSEVLAAGMHTDKSLRLAMFESADLP